VSVVPFRGVLKKARRGMNKTKIEWCDSSWNPITGCLNNCPFPCYARAFYHRFSWSFLPQFHPDRLDEPIKLKQPARIFVGSVSDLWGKGVEPCWRAEVFKVIEKCPTHTYIMLTKQPHRIENFEEIPKDVWLGVSIAGQQDTWRADHIKEFRGIKFISLEPLLSAVDFNEAWLAGINWVIIGGLTGSKRFIPPKEWVDVIIREARGMGIPVFLKDNLHYPKMIQEFPLSIKKAR